MLFKADGGHMELAQALLIQCAGHPLASKVLDHALDTSLLSLGDVVMLIVIHCVVSSLLSLSLYLLYHTVTGLSSPCFVKSVLLVSSLSCSLCACVMRRLVVAPREPLGHRQAFLAQVVHHALVAIAGGLAVQLPVVAFGPVDGVEALLAHVGDDGADGLDALHCGVLLVSLSL